MVRPCKVVFCCGFSVLAEGGGKVGVVDERGDVAGNVVTGRVVGQHQAVVTVAEVIAGVARGGGDDREAVAHAFAEFGGEVVAVAEVLGFVDDDKGAGAEFVVEGFGAEVLMEGDAVVDAVLVDDGVDA